MKSRRETIIEGLFMQTRMNQRIIGVSCGSGLAAKQAERGGADILLALTSGRFRMMGQGSLAGFLPFSNSNQLVMEFGARELVPAVNIPVVFGLNATDPTILMDQYINRIKASGFAGVNNYPTIGLIDGQYREALEEQGLTFDMEVEAIRMAHDIGLFTIAFVFDEVQAEKMLNAGADVLCVHLGLTKGGARGAKKVLTLEAGTQLAKQVFSVGDRIRPEVFRMVYGGPVHTPMDLEYLYNNTTAQGYIGGSTFDRTPSEKAIEERVRQFKTTEQSENDELLQKMLFGMNRQDYVEFVKEYVAQNYMNDIAFTDLASVAKLSRSHLSMLFRKETGLTFPAFLTNFRIHKACDIIEQKDIPFSDVAALVGYSDYAHFSKTFKKMTGCSPSEYREQK